jgi:cytochrome c
MRSSEITLPGPLRGTRPTLLAAALGLFASATALAQGPTYRLGTPASQEQIRATVPAVAAEGKELPRGSGTAKQGSIVYTQKCAACHGPEGKGTPLHRGLIPLGNAKPVKIEGSLVPYATTVWDFINRGMPWAKPGSLTADEVYAVTAYVLFLNQIISDSDVMDATTLPKVRMPNRDRFVGVELDWKPGQKRPLGFYPEK